MDGDVDTVIRGPKAYDLARKAVEVMERQKIWPTPLNFELWIHYVGNPDGPLGREIQRLLGIGETITETVSEELAAQFLPKARLNEQIRDAGDQLNKELAAVADAVSQAQKSTTEYGQTLARANGDLAGVDDAVALKKMIDGLSGATRKALQENSTLEKQLAESTAEVARLKDHLEQVRRDATTDALTNLANRKAFDEEGERAVADADADGQPLCMAVLDIDHFKNFNDTWGHQTGDQVIRFVASVIGRMAAPPRFAARYGGEEFAMIFPGETTAVVGKVLEEIRIEISSRMLKRRSTNEDLGTISVSAGVAQRIKGESLHSLIERADGALYYSKRNGRNMVTAAESINKAA
ncbi:GGDEF domain-containing protein [soil metagenome]